jgi:hypothetical protein
MADKTPLCRTLDEIEQAGRDRVRRNGWSLTQPQREHLWVLLRPYADQLVNDDPAGDPAA